MVISSKENEQIKNIKKLKEKKYRDAENKYIVEGIKLVKEAINEDVKIDSIVICEECINNSEIEENLLYKIAKYNCLYVTKNVFLTLSDVNTPQGILAVIVKENNDVIEYNEDLILILDGIQDPGNLGTILRTLDSVGIKQIIISKDTADCYNPKVVRSTMGAIFRVNIIQSENLQETIKIIKKQKYKVVATSLQTQKNIYDIDYNKVAIVIGNEANGVSKKVFEMVDEKVIIPMLGKTESLNAAVATGVILYEYVRRKVL